MVLGCDRTRREGTLDKGVTSVALMTSVYVIMVGHLTLSIDSTCSWTGFRHFELIHVLSLGQSWLRRHSGLQPIRGSPGGSVT